MFRSRGAIILALTLFAGTIAAGPAAAVSPVKKPEVYKVAVHGGSRHVRRHVQARYVHGPYGPHYLDRPYYYAPAPFFPLLGLGYGPWW